jgi:hypothetical protein
VDEGRKAAAQARRIAVEAEKARLAARPTLDLSEAATRLDQAKAAWRQDRGNQQLQQDFLDAGHDLRKALSPERAGIGYREHTMFPGYAITDHGRVFSKDGDELPRHPGKYLRVNMQHRDGRRRTAHLHRLVCEAYHGPAPSPIHHAAHWDGDKENNSASNLRWATPQENEADKVRHGRRPASRDHSHGATA